MALDTVHYAIGGVPHSQRTDKELIFSKRKWDVEDKKFGVSISGPFRGIICPFPL